MTGRRVARGSASRRLASAAWHLAVLWMAAAVALALLTPCAGAEVPPVIAYQGRLTEDDGRPLVGEHTVKFRMYSDVAGGAKLWEETHRLALTLIDNGIFSVVLGGQTPFGALAFNQPLWLALEVDGDGEMKPRLRLTAAGYAINADTLDGVDSETFLRRDRDIVAAGRLTLTHATATALIIRPSKDPGDNAKVIDVQDTSGGPRFSVDREGDVAVAGDLSVSGRLLGGGLSAGGGGTVTSVEAGAGLGGGPVTAAGALHVGAGPGLEVTPDAVGIKLLAGSGLAAGDDGLSLARNCAGGQLLKWETASSGWVCAADQAGTATGTITGVVAGSGLSGGGSSGTVELQIGVGPGLVLSADAIAVDVGAGPHQLVQLTGDSALPAVSGALLTGLNASNLSSGTVPDAQLPSDLSRLGPSIESAEIVDGQVQRLDLADHSVGPQALAADAIQPGDIEVDDLPPHAGRHLPGAADALPTAAPVDIGASNAIGGSTSFARADHVHEGLHGLRADGQPQLGGDVTLSAGSGIQLSQSGQSIQIEATGGGQTAGANASASASSELAISTSDDTTLLSVSITKSSASSAMMVLATVQLRHTNGNSKTVDVKVFRDSAQVDSAYRARVASGANQDFPATLHFWDAPAAGTYTYTLRARSSGNGAQATIRRLSVIELQ